MSMIRCYQCMEVFDGSYEVCPHCGYVINSLPSVAYHLYPGTVLNQRYVIGTVLGYGGFGVTYNAWDLTLNIRVAVKEYFPQGLVNRIPGTTDLIILSGDKAQQYQQGLERFIDEAQNTICFNSHPNIVNIYSFFEENHTAYIVMEYLDGPTLKEYLKQEGGVLPVDTSIEIISSICDALTDVHKHGIIHRDINPSNICLCSNGTKLIDFGAARISETEYERTRSIVITPGYAPPEQYQSKSKQGPWTDTYALSATLYRMLTGHRPIESIDRLADDQLELPRNYRSDIPKWLENIVMNGIALNYEFRYKTAENLKEALQTKLELDLPETRIRKRKRRRILVFGGVSLLSLGAVVGAVIAYSSHQRGAIRNGTTLEIEVPSGQTEVYQELYDQYFAAAYPTESSKINIQFTESASNPAIYPYGSHKDIKPMKASQFWKQSVDMSQYYLISDYCSTNPESTMIPTGYHEVVAYISKPSAQKRDYSIPSTMSIYDLSEDFWKNVVCLDSLESSMPDIISQLNEPQFQESAVLSEGFAMRNIDVLIATDAELSSILDVCQSHNNDSSTISLNYEIVPLRKDNMGQGFWTDCWCIQDSLSTSEKEAAKLWMQFLLTDGIQETMYVSGVNSLKGIPLNCTAFQEYVNYNVGMQAFLEENVKTLEIYSAEEQSK